MLHHHFHSIDDVLISDNTGEDPVTVNTYKEAFQLCRHFHYHEGHGGDGYGVNVEADDDEFGDSPDHEKPEENRDWEDLAVRRAETCEDHPDALGKRAIDLAYDHSRHVGPYPDLDIGRE